MWRFHIKREVLHKQSTLGMVTMTRFVLESYDLLAKSGCFRKCQFLKDKISVFYPELFLNSFCGTIVAGS